MTDRPGTARPETDAPYLFVTFGDPDDDPGSWRTVGVQTSIKNRIAYEMESHRRGYAPLTSGAIYTMWRFVAWHALHARGDFPGTLAEFAEQVFDVRARDNTDPDDTEIDAGADAARPTPPGVSSE
jgi:hypothetical protein